MRPLNLILTLVFLCFISIASFAQVGVMPEKASLDISKSITLYPNPTVDFINIKLASLKANKVKLTFYNILGNEVPAETEVVDDHEIRVRVKEFSTGYYLVAVRDEETQFRGTYKFLKR